MRGGEEPVICDPGSELRLGGRGKRRAKIINGTGGKRKKKMPASGQKQTKKNSSCWCILLPGIASGGECHSGRAAKQIPGTVFTLCLIHLEVLHRR